MTQISKNFKLSELYASQTAKAKGINNEPPLDVIVNLIYLVARVLQPLRSQMGAPIAIGSGYRCAALNKAVGGVANSQHMSGQAVDICLPMVGGKQDLTTGKAWFEYIRKNLPFDQLIWEHNAKGSYWIHVSYNFKGNRGQVIDNLLKK